MCVHPFGARSVLADPNGRIDFALPIPDDTNNSFPAQLPDRIYGKHGTLDLGPAPSLRFNGDFRKEFAAKNEGTKWGKGGSLPNMMI